MADDDDAAPNVPASFLVPLEAVVGLATSLRTFHVTLVDQGFTDAEALVLTGTMLQSMFNNKG